jgi:8-oxo-dGTP pyrophosphatase MutT (NUDIX family)
MKKRVTAGIIFHDGKKFFAARPTGKDKWDMPKGRVEDGENHVEAALREVEEETGIYVPSLANMIDMGVRSYNDEKDIHLYIYYGNLDFIKIENCTCKATFNSKYGRDMPEMCEYKFIPFDFTNKKTFKESVLRKHFQGNMFRVLNDIFEETNL